jgi:hypothetical protein
VPLTPAALWLLSQELADLHQFNQSLLLESAGAFDPAAAAALAAAVATLVAHHDALRLRLERTAAGWRQLIAPLDPDPRATTITAATSPSRTPRARPACGTPTPNRSG